MDAQTFCDVIADSAVILDKAGRIMQWSLGATHLFGYHKKEMIGRSVNCIYDRNYPFPKLIQEVQTQQKKWYEETPFIRKNGSKGFCVSYLYPIPTDENNKAHSLLIHQNISHYKETLTELEVALQRKTDEVNLLLSGYVSANYLLVKLLNELEQIERKLSESELRFHLLAENATDTISRHTTDGLCLYISPSSKSSTGYAPDELIGKRIYKWIHHEDQNKIKKAFARRRDNNNKPVVYRIRKKDGEFRWFESNIRRIVDAHTRHISEIQLASRDITDRVLDRKAQLRGQQLAHVFRLSTMEEMASGMAHEITQPLAAIVNYTRGCARHLQNNEYDGEQLKLAMEKAVQQAERAGEILHRLKNFFCKGQLVKSRAKINHVIRETVNLIKNELTSTKTKVTFNFDKRIPFIYIDKIQIQQVILNLLQNAIESMNEKHGTCRRIHIKSKTIGNYIEVTINDTGPGFSKEIINKVFTPFFTTKAHGRGMGLAICRSIIEAHGGQFTINPNIHNNSWIRFSLPFAI